MDLSPSRLPASSSIARVSQHNIAAMQALASSAGVRLRPHAKTHKSPAIARWQLDAGAVGICCAKLGEAEVLRRGRHHRHPAALSGQSRQRRARRRAARSRRTPVDHRGRRRRGARRGRRRWSPRDGSSTCSSRSTSAFIAAASIPTRRASSTTIRARQRALRPALSRAAEPRRPRLRRGIAGRARGHRRTRSRDPRGPSPAALREAGVDVAEISVGATPTARFITRQHGVTEMRPGNYVFFDRTQVGLGAATARRLRDVGRRDGRQPAGARRASSSTPAARR